LGIAKLHLNLIKHRSTTVSNTVPVIVVICDFDIADRGTVEQLGNVACGLAEAHVCLKVFQITLQTAKFG
jgi:hypothetical protein